LHGSAKKTLLLAILSCIGVAIQGHSLSEQTPGNGQSGVDQAGPYVIGYDKDHSKNVAEVRDFLWRHWREHRPGRLLATWISLEGRSTETVYVVGNDENGVWSLKVTKEWPDAGSQTSPRSRVESKVYRIRRIKPRHDGQSPAIFLPDDEPRSAERYRLVFFDEKGNEVGGV
jgi:hypothetical protein